MNLFIQQMFVRLLCHEYIQNFICQRKILHMGNTESLDQCR